MRSAQFANIEGRGRQRHIEYSCGSVLIWEHILRLLRMTVKSCARHRRGRRRNLARRWRRCTLTLRSIRYACQHSTALQNRDQTCGIQRKVLHLINLGGKPRSLVVTIKQKTPPFLEPIVDTSQHRSLSRDTANLQSTSSSDTYQAATLVGAPLSNLTSFEISIPLAGIFVLLIPLCEPLNFMST